MCDINVSFADSVLGFAQIAVVVLLAGPFGLRSLKSAFKPLKALLSQGPRSVPRTLAGPSASGPPRRCDEARPHRLSALRHSGNHPQRQRFTVLHEHSVPRNYWEGP